MASNPYFSPLHTQRFSLVGSPQQRDGLTGVRDQRFLNCYPERIDSDLSGGKKYYVKKRPGTAGLISQTGATGLGRGVYYWNNGFYSVVGNSIYYNSTLLGTLGTAVGPVGFTEYEYENGAIDLLFSDGLNLYLVQPSNAITLIGAVTFPHIPYPIYMDGYVFLAVAGTSDIRNSTLDDPTDWPSDQFINAEMYPDNITMLVKNQNYIVAIGQDSTEFFYDNGTATGSPLQRNAPAVSQFGTPAPNTVSQTEKQVIFVGSTKNGGRTVWQIDGFQPTEIGIEPVRESLDAEGLGMSQAFAYTVQVSGHKFYILNLKASQRTWVYDFDEKMWHEWSTGATQTCFFCDYCSDSPNGWPVVQGTSDGVLYKLSEDVYSDLSGTSAIFMQITTVKVDFETIKRKKFFRLSLIGDAPTSIVDSPITVEFSDDDYNSWGVARTLNMNPYYPTITRLGTARRRAFRFTYTQPSPLRLEAFELDITQEVRR